MNECQQVNLVPKKPTLSCKRSLWKTPKPLNIICLLIGISNGQSSCFLRRPQELMKSSSSIWDLQHNVKSDGKDFIKFCGLLRKHKLDLAPNLQTQNLLFAVKRGPIQRIFGSEICVLPLQRKLFLTANSWSSEYKTCNNVCLKKNGTRRSSNTLLCFVPVFLKQTLVRTVRLFLK